MTAYAQRTFLLGLIVFSLALLGGEGRWGEKASAVFDLTPGERVMNEASLSVLEQQGSVGSISATSDEAREVEATDQTAFPNQPFLAASGAVRDMPFTKRANDSVPEISARIALVSDLQSGTRYLEKNTDQHWPVASITKLMTSAVAWDTIATSTEIQLTNQDFSLQDTSQIRHLKVGETYTALDLVKAMLTVSSNEAAEAVARFSGREAFLQAMNDKAELWGLTSTYFYDPSGLSPVNQSTALDLERMMYHLYRDQPQVLSLSRESRASIRNLATKRTLTLTSINQFAGGSRFLGGKTGYIDEARGNLVSLFLLSGRPVLFVVMDTDNRFGDTEALVDWFQSNYQ